MTNPHDTPDLARELVRIHGLDNEDSLRGIYLDGVVLDPVQARLRLGV